MFLDTTLGTVDDEDFDLGVGTRLDNTFGPRPSMSVGPAAGMTDNQPAMDCLALSKMLSTTIGTNMMLFSQAVTPTGGAVGATGGDTALATGKGFNQDQIAKLKDACGVCNAQQIPAIWLVIQSTTGKSFDTYCAHIAKSLELWCRSHHIDHDKSIFLEAKFSVDLVALRFNPGGPVAQFHSVAWGMSMLVCHLLMAMAAEFCREYEEAAESTRHTRSLDDLLKRNRGKTVEPASTYTDLKLNIGTYCGLLWTIFGNHCDYYKELLKIYHILDRKECFTIQNAYTRGIWTIVDEGRSFFGRNPVALDFAPGKMSPGGDHGFSPTWEPAPALPPPPPGGPPPTRPGGQEDTCHPKIKLLMGPYLKQYNNYVNIPEILTASGKRMSDLPTLPKYPSCVGIVFWGDASADLGAGLPGPLKNGRIH